mmetsp:Transcript_67441/g.163148  ORF Transcript_67441/g.163148 Transcript_67441/m.163148 type:complete len:127 (+) Transcript_67441:230-610(+)
MRLPLPAPAAEPAAAAARPGPKKALTPEQQDQIRRRMAKLPPEARKALDNWVNMKEEDRWALLGMNCLVIVLFLGLFVLFAAYLIGAHGINIFELETWRSGATTARKILQEIQGGKRVVTAHDAEL